MLKEIPVYSKAKIAVLKFFEAFMTHDLLTLAAALAFYTALALAPLLLITLSVVGVRGEDSKNLLTTQIQGLMGKQASTAINAIIESTKAQPSKGGAAGIIGVVILLFSASGVFAQLQSSLNIIWQTPSKSLSKKDTSGKSTWLRKRLLSMGMVFSLGFIAMVSLIISSVLAYFFTQNGLVWEAISIVSSLFIFSALFTLIYKYLPDVKISWAHARIGGLLTATLFMVGKVVIGLYLGKSAMGSAYGAAGSLIVLLAWVYYSSVVVFSGAEVTRLMAANDGNKKTVWIKDFKKEVMG